MVPLCTSIGGVAKCVGDVAMSDGDHMKVLIFLCFLTRGTVICHKNNLEMVRLYRCFVLRC